MDGITDSNNLINNVKVCWTNMDYKNVDSIVTDLDQGGLKLSVSCINLDWIIIILPPAHNW